MKEGRVFVDLKTEVDRQAEAKRDFLTDTSLLIFEKGQLIIPKVSRMSVSTLCHRQIGERIGIPFRYYGRMLGEAPDLLDANVNHWFTSKPEKRMVRTLGNSARAFLSNRYRRLDNIDLLRAAESPLEKAKCGIVSCEITETSLYLKAVTDKVQGEVRPGDVIQAGVSISNSEVGMGAAHVQTMLYRLACLNGAIVGGVIKGFHIGRAQESSDSGAEEFVSSEAQAASDYAFWLKFRDAVVFSLSEANFNERLNRIKAATTRELPKANIIPVVEELGQRSAFSEKEITDTVHFLTQSGDLTQYGLANAMTQMSQDVESYDRATELEALGGAVMEMAQTDWSRLLRN